MYIEQTLASVFGHNVEHGRGRIVYRLMSLEADRVHRHIRRLELAAPRRRRASLAPFCSGAGSTFEKQTIKL